MGLERMTGLRTLLVREGISIIYDGECPFCSAYLKILRLREAVGKVTLVDARQYPDLVNELTEQDLKIDQEMVVVYGGAIYSGGEAINVLALLTSPSGIVNRLVSGVMKKPDRARTFYPYLRGGRNLALKLLGRAPIG
jgi:predicted DCC family thiol-disulfide oxidoreductase YuxK